MNSNYFLPGVRAMLGALILASPAAFGAPVFTPADQPFGSVPPLGITGFNLSTGTQRAFQGWFDPNTWSGDLTAYPLSTTGQMQLSEVLWHAATEFDDSQSCFPSDPVGSTTYYDTGRRIVTRDSAAGVNIPFRWSALPAAYQTAIGDAVNGPKILNFVRGDRSNEKYQEVVGGDGVVQSSCGVAGGTLRARNNILGDVIHGRPVFVGPPPGDYLFASYPAYKASKASRAPRVYVGANDGMMHAFDVDTGAEVWAYVPSMLRQDLKDLATTPYTHKYFVDGGIAAADADFSGSGDWHTVIAGGLGAGGKGLFALDATSATAATETEAKTKILWEITPATTGFSDLGYTYGDPLIVRLSTGRWAMIAGNGYLNSNSGHAVLYIIDIGTGALIKALDTGSGSVASPNGLSSPIAVDTDGDSKVDRVYAGDIDGNVWKFDISNASAATWSAPATPLYATGRAIVGAPDVAPHPVSGYLVYFATGRILTPADATNATVQNYIYAIWDGAPAANTTILQQTLTEAAYGAQRVRVSSGLPINWSDASATATKPLHRGWRTALPPGESVIGTGFVRDGRYQLTSVNPTITQAAPPNGENWLMEVDYLTGGAGDKPIFDLSRDGLVNDADRVSVSGTLGTGAASVAVGLYMGAGLVSQPVLATVNAKLSTTLFNDNPYTSPGDVPAAPVAPAVPDLDPGVTGGHFDIDLYFGSTTNHFHEYDDIYGVTGVNFLNPSDPKENIDLAITSTSTKFKILIANQRLSPAVKFSFGGQPYVSVPQLETTAGLKVASLPTFTRANVGTLKYNMPKDAFTPKDWGTGEVRSGLVPTQTGCVHGAAPGDLGPAPNFLYRNGALVFQLIKDTTPDSAIQLADAAGDPRYGYRLKDANRSTYVLAEWSTFWHHPNKFCLGDAGWTKSPALDPAPADPTKAKIPAAGSSDPPRDEFGAITSSSTVTSVDVACSGCKIRTTTIEYSTGGSVIIKEYLDKKGVVTKTVIINVVPVGGGGGGGGGAGAGGVVQALSTPNTLTGYQQTRNTGKLGRVSWRELFKQ